MAYVYRHVRLDKNIPFYVGIGRDTNYYRSRSVHGRNKLWKRIAAVSAFEVEVMLDDLSWEEACIKEIEFIALYKRINDGGVLANITTGGEGTAGIKNPHTSERNKKGLRTGKKHTEEAKIRMSIASKARGNPHWVGRKHSASAKEKMSKAKKGIPLSEEHRKKVGLPHIGNKYNLGRKISEQTRKLYSEIRLGDKNGNYKGVIEAYKDGILFGTYAGIVVAGRELGIPNASIFSFLNGKGKSVHGYTFKRLPKDDNSREAKNNDR